MRRYILNGPSVEPLTLQEAKRVLRIDHADDDAHVQSLIKAARQRVEARTGRALITQDWRIVLDSWPWGGRTALPVLPAQAVTAVRVYPATGAPQTYTPPVYNLLAGTEPPVLDASAVPGPGKARDGIEIDVTAGYGATAAAVPDPLKQAMRLMIAHAYAATGPDGRRPDALEPPEINALLAPYRLGRVGAPLQRMPA
jgi:uncharacterized phiE125 gp8 family phage protein